MHARALLDALGDAGTEVLRAPVVREDGSRIAIAFTVALLEDADGRVTGIARP